MEKRKESVSAKEGAKPIIVAFTPNGRKVACPKCGETGTVKIGDSSRGQWLKAFCGNCGVKWEIHHRMRAD